MSSMETLGFSQFVVTATHQEGHGWILFFGAGIAVDLITADAVLWFSHFALKVQLGTPNSSLFKRQVDSCSPKPLMRSLSGTFSQVSTKTVSLLLFAICNVNG